jgi:hypothetical protein
MEILPTMTAIESIKSKQRLYRDIVGGIVLCGALFASDQVYKSTEHIDNYKKINYKILILLVLFFVVRMIVDGILFAINKSHKFGNSKYEWFAICALSVIIPLMLTGSAYNDYVPDLELQLQQQIAVIPTITVIYALSNAVIDKKI